LIGLHIPEVAQLVRRLLLSPVDIVDQIYVVEGYTFLVSQRIHKDEIAQHVSIIIDAFGNVDFESCDSGTALNVLKVVFAVGKTLYTTAPGNLNSKAWTEGHGREMVEWVRITVATFSRRFSEDFEIMEAFLIVSQANDRSSQISFNSLYLIMQVCWCFRRKTLLN
jgi:hypothetical protein